jgi:RNA-binding protein 39
MLKNMFNPDKETDPNFHLEIQEEVAEEAKKFGDLKNAFVDKNSKLGQVYLKV